MGDAVNVNFKLDDAELKRAIESLGTKFPTVAQRALRKAAVSGRALMVKEIAKDMGLPSSRVRREIDIVFIGSNAVTLQTQGERIPLIDFGARGPEPSKGKGRGVSYRLPGGRGRAEHAFIATMGGHRGVFQRRGRERTPVSELRGPSINLVFAKFLSLGAQRAEESLTKNLASEISFAMSRR